mmetsp:Transcript_17049/g.48004  ORF Transcript_17049/g.48004 Transcript_17049/m.48004 type:complete len:318 (+) Transcript_17049:2181-3134(+)
MAAIPRAAPYRESAFASSLRRPMSSLTYRPTRSSLWRTSFTTSPSNPATAPWEGVFRADMTRSRTSTTRRSLGSRWTTEPQSRISAPSCRSSCSNSEYPAGCGSARRCSRAAMISVFAFPVQWRTRREPSSSISCRTISSGSNSALSSSKKDSIRMWCPSSTAMRYGTSAHHARARPHRPAARRFLVASVSALLDGAPSMSRFHSGISGGGANSCHMACISAMHSPGTAPALSAARAYALPASALSTSSSEASRGRRQARCAGQWTATSLRASQTERAWADVVSSLSNAASWAAASSCCTASASASVPGAATLRDVT